MIKAGDMMQARLDAMAAGYNKSGEDERRN